MAKPEKARGILRPESSKYNVESESQKNLSRGDRGDGGCRAALGAAGSLGRGAQVIAAGGAEDLRALAAATANRDSDSGDGQEREQERGGPPGKTDHAD